MTKAAWTAPIIPPTYDVATQQSYLGPIWDLCFAVEHIKEDGKHTLEQVQELVRISWETGRTLGERLDV